MAIERIVDSVPVSKNENIAGFMHTQIPEITDDNGTASKAGYKNICE